jgi:hypothetical protein
MSTLKTNTLSNVAGTASTAIENAINGSAKAWVNFNGTGTVAIRASYNVTSITDLGTGLYQINFTNAMVDINYAISLTKQNTLSNLNFAVYDDIATRATTSVSMYTLENATTVDSNNVNVIIFR